MSVYKDISFDVYFVANMFTVCASQLSGVSSDDESRQDITTFTVVCDFYM